MDMIRVGSSAWRRALALLAGAFLLGIFSTAQAGYRVGVLSELNMSDHYLKLADGTEYPLSLRLQTRLWRENASGQLMLKPGMRVRLELAPQNDGDGRQAETAVGITPAGTGK
jgi:hypothetical protein